MLVKASFSASLKQPKKINNKNEFKIVKFFFSYWKDSEETDQEFRIRILNSKGIDIKDCNYTGVKIN